MITSARMLALCAILLAPPLARADEGCRLELGRGWPPGTENHGSAVEQLLSRHADAPVLTLTLLPLRGAESGLVLIPGEGEGDWAVRHAKAEHRVSDWSNSRDGARRELRTEQEPLIDQAAIPAGIARRVVALWQRTLTALVPADRAAPFHDDNVWLFALRDPASGEVLRVSGLAPGCGPAELLMAQRERIIDTIDDDPEDRHRGWAKLEASLRELQDRLEREPAIASAAPGNADATVSATAGDNDGND
ncbi:hypothetical protein ACFQZQ_12840 [Lysobacter koreensis]|uniref:Uncharacterized protein n=1 Tax=Lysobacter koreensis TaxID=266122 RepID=A0ABW2YP99_9GAMM